VLVTFSGIDGSGKTTYAESIAEALRERGYPAFTGRPVYLTCKAVESFCEAQFGSLTSFVTRLDPQVYLHALTADWLEHLTRTLRHHDGKIILCDRYVYDMVAQLVHYRTDPGPALRLLGYFPEPALSYLLTISPEDARARIDRRGPPSRDLESLDNLRLLEQAYGDVRRLLSWSPIERESTFDLDTVIAEILALAHRDERAQGPGSGTGDTRARGGFPSMVGTAP
jgi:thymidylate kinase